MSGGTCGGEQEDWIPLRMAFSHAHAIEEARLGVQSPRGTSLLESGQAQVWAPSSRELQHFLRETRCIPVQDLAYEREKGHLTLSDIAASSAHRRLVSLFRASCVPVRAKATGTYLRDHVAVRRQQILIPGKFWQTEEPTSEVVYGPIPDYATGTILDDAWDLSVMFSGRICDAEVPRQRLLDALGPLQFPEVIGGTFRRAGSGWEVACGGRSTIVAASDGMGYLAVLLTHPHVPIQWDSLYVAGQEAGEGRPPKDWKREAFLERRYDDEWREAWARKRENEDHLKSIVLDIKKLKSIINKVGEVRKEVLQRNIIALEECRKRAQNAANRLDTPRDDDRARVQHALRAAFRVLAVHCPDFVRHVGTYQERRALSSIRGAGMVYAPRCSDGTKAEVEWDTRPRK